MVKVLLVLAVLIAGLGGFVATRPTHFVVARSATIKAPPDIVYANVVDFHEWSDWSPWDKLDPQQKTTFSGADRGVGAVYEWKGNDKVGEGKMTIKEAVPAQRVGLDLEFVKPMQAHNQTAFVLAPAPGGTLVTWSMEGDNGFVAKAFGVFMNMDKMIGGDFDRGLTALGIASESDAKKAAEVKAAEEAKQAAAAAQAAPTIPPATGTAPAPAAAPTAAPAPAK